MIKIYSVMKIINLKSIKLKIDENIIEVNWELKIKKNLPYVCIVDWSDTA